MKDDWIWLILGGGLILYLMQQGQLNAQTNLITASTNSAQGLFNLFGTGTD